MNEKNTDYLKDQVKYHGFGESLFEEMVSQISKDVPEFTLAYKSEVNRQELDATLYFRRSDSTGMYFFNKYDVSAKLEKGEEKIAQTFYMNRGQGVTLKEAYNLLNGRAVHKELFDREEKSYKAWIQLDMGARDKNGNFERKQYHQNYGYDIREALSYFPIKELKNEDDRRALVRSLEKGNVQMVTMSASGKETRLFIEANPQYKTVNIYQSNMQRLDNEKKQELMIKPDSLKKEIEKKEQLGKEDQREKKEKAPRKVKEGANENGIIRKKRENKDKGLGI